MQRHFGTRKQENLLIFLHFPIFILTFADAHTNNLRHMLTFRIFLKWSAIVLAVMAAVVTIVLIVCNAIVVRNARGRIFGNTTDVPASDVALLLGTSPVSRITGRTNYFYEYRLDAAAELYKAGKVKRILVSGSDNSHDGINEVESMQADLEKRGIPTASILCDGKGYRTEASVRRTHEVYGLRSFTVVSQHFHNERTLYLTDHLGLDFEQVQAYDARQPEHALSYITYAREYLARVKMFLDLAKL